ncbi:DNA topoisomerase [Pseudogemmobacter faecipullorum]|uniref:DNA topoisomerase n=1 Tax=Pseudogemmobacter faecipullorum TaxID=2755041 RepID=A0ABS8CQR6_9RHOB|nr:DNA topoisomerase [Pseudogemmobacter faecipullorum]MCB5411701.1 recombinase RmuC [Pseudogemmobacter faecipullorum]
MASIVIAEKPSQAQTYRTNIGNRYGEILSARGHLFELMPPDKLRPERWKEWSIGLLREGDEFYPSIFRDADAEKRYREIRERAKKADTIYIATDPDREGEGIGGDIIQQLKRDINWDGRLLRVLPLGEDKKSIEEAFAKAQPAENLRLLYQSYKARSNADHIYNLSLTRSASEALTPKGVRMVVSIGRVLTPAFGIVCRRELAIRNHVPRDYFHPWVQVQGAAGQTKLTHNPGEKGRMFDAAEAQKIADLAKDYKGPITVRKDRGKQQKPPVLFSLSKLQVEASRRFKWPVEKTTDVMQALYETHKVATYPRSMEVSLPEAEIENAPAMFKGILGLPFMAPVSYAQAGPVIRREKGAFSDKDLKGAAHSAIVPNVNTIKDWPAIWQRMNSDEQTLFELIARRYLAAVSPNRVYDATKLSIVLGGKDFSTSGTVEVSPGWHEAMGRAAKEAAGDEEAAEDDAGALPPFNDQDPVQSTGTGLQKLTTKPPPRLTDASILIEMIEAWRQVEDPQLRAILKETEGIGTEATRKDVVVNMKDRGFISLGKGSVVTVTEGGMALYNTLLKYAPKLLDVGMTAELEHMLNSIKSGEAKAAETVNKICQLAQDAIDGLIRAQQDGVILQGLTVKKGGGKPTPAMVMAAKSKAKREGKKSPPSGVLTDFDKCRAYLGELKPRGEGETGPRPASAAQMNFATKIAAEKGLALPDGIEKDSRKVSEWIEQNKGGSGAGAGAASSGPRPASAAQMNFANKIAAEKGLKLPDGIEKDSRKVSEWIEKNKSAGPAANGAAKTYTDGAPSSKSIGFAESIAARKGLEIPDYARKDRVALSKWIDTNK